jgi:hypothetical protein
MAAHDGRQPQNAAPKRFSETLMEEFSWKTNKNTATCCRHQRPISKAAKYRRLPLCAADTNPSNLTRRDGWL